MHPFPSLTKRYLASFIDGILLFLAFLTVTSVFQVQAESGMRLHIGIIGALLVLYEPLCTSKLYTLGQFVVGMRVRSISTGKKISIPAAYARFVTKFLLGFISFFYIGASEKRRTLHDLAAGSIVLDANDASD